MIAAVLKAADAAGLRLHSRAMPVWGWWLLALTAIALRTWVKTGTGLDGYLGDSDDATRLIQVREFMGAAPWFDTTTMTMGGTSGMLSHWSRLIDLPLAAMLWTFGVVMPAETAEILVRALWPIMVLAPVLFVLFRTTSDMAGVHAGGFALLLAVLCPLALYQFDAGRIDHHNVMIAATVSAALLMWAHTGDARAWRIAGALCGLALAIGYEALAPAAALAVFAALWGLFDRDAANAARAFTLALMATLALTFVLTISPSRWLDVRCDALSLNLVALVCFGGGGLMLALGRGRDWALWRRFAAVGVATAMGGAVFGVLEPKCLAGPMGQLPLSLKPIWLDLVAESRSIIADFFSGDFEQSLGILAFFAIGIGLQFRQLRLSRAKSDAFLLAVILAFALFACWQYKYMSYASFVMLPPMAIAILRLNGCGDVSAPTIRFAAAVMMSQGVLLAGSEAVEAALATPKLITKEIRADAEACSKSDAIRELASLPPGLISAHIDIGAYIAALTPHRVLSAPYHRIPDAIFANHTLLASRSDAVARATIAREGVDYVVTCRGLDDPFVSDEAWKGSLRANLVANQAPAYLTPVTLANRDSIFRVWRVDRDKLNPQP